MRVVLVERAEVKMWLILAAVGLLMACTDPGEPYSKDAVPVPDDGPLVTLTVPTTVAEAATTGPAPLLALAATTRTRIVQAASQRVRVATTQRVYAFANCTQAWAAGRAPLRRGQPGYSTKLDRDRDGTACEVRP